MFTKNDKILALKFKWKMEFTNKYIFFGAKI